jgi:hypothetical protein
MGLDLWFGEDVARILASTQETMRSAMGGVGGVEAERAVAYGEGFADALRAVAIAFGVCPPTMVGRPGVGHLARRVPIAEIDGVSPGGNGARQR